MVPGRAGHPTPIQPEHQVAGSLGCLKSFVFERRDSLPFASNPKSNGPVLGPEPAQRLVDPAFFEVAVVIVEGQELESVGGMRVVGPLHLTLKPASVAARIAQAITISAADPYDGLRRTVGFHHRLESGFEQCKSFLESPEQNQRLRVHSRGVAPDRPGAESLRDFHRALRNLQTPAGI